jgi:hypothetical protein
MRLDCGPEGADAAGGYELDMVRKEARSDRAYEVDFRWCSCADRQQNG